MGFLCADRPMLPMRWEQFVIERRGASIGTLLFRSQCKRVVRLGFRVSMGLFSSVPAAAYAAGTAGAPEQGAPPLPLPPPPVAAQPAPNEPLPPPPVPRSAPIPPPAATAIPVAVAPSVAPPGAPGSDLPPLPLAPWGSNLHDGFYLRLALGAGIAGALVSSDSRSIGDYSFGGGAGAFDLWIGGTPTSGLAMGAALSGLGLSSSQRSVDGNRVSGDVSGSTGLLGYFVDVFPDPQRGLHFGGALGLASGVAQVKGSDRKFSGGGLGLQAWGGYEFWVSPQWSLGGMLRFMGSVTREQQEPVSYEASIGAATLSFTALYH